MTINAMSLAFTGTRTNERINLPADVAVVAF